MLFLIKVVTMAKSSLALKSFYYEKFFQCPLSCLRWKIKYPAKEKKQLEPLTVKTAFYLKFTPFHNLVKKISKTFF